MFVAGFAYVLLAVVVVVDSNEKNDDKRLQSQDQSTLADAFKKIAELEQRLSEYDSKRMMVLRGRDGRDGKDGTIGKDGTNGKDGAAGPKGRDGRDGIPGRPGLGRDGANGKDGAAGPQGTPGMQGSPGKHGAKGPRGPKSGGVKYTRWGRTSCPSGADLVYKGRIGGERYTHTGGAAEYVCLTESPKFGNYKPGHQNAAYMYGTEYELQFNPFSTSNLHDHDAPCAVCHVTTRNSRLMIPATYECPAGWTREYHGYMMSSYHGHNHPTKFLCVDQDAEAVKGSSAGLDGALLYPVEGVCGALPCHPYVTGRELTCAVCTK